MAEIENVVIIDRFDYDELVEKARMTDEEIKKEAERIFMGENGVLVRIEFNEYPNSKNFTAPIGFIRGGEKEDIYEKDTRSAQRKHISGTTQMVDEAD